MPKWPRKNGLRRDWTFNLGPTGSPLLRGFADNEFRAPAVAFVGHHSSWRGERGTATGDRVITDGEPGGLQSKFG